MPCRRSRAARSGVVVKPSETSWTQTNESVHTSEAVDERGGTQWPTLVRWTKKTLWVVWAIAWAVAAMFPLYETATLVSALNIPLNTVDPRNLTAPDPVTGLRPYEQGSWWPYIPITVLGLCLSVLPSKPRVLTGLGQGLLALYLAITTSFFVMLTVGFTLHYGKTGFRECFYEGCWPVEVQSKLVLIPLGLTILAMLLMATVFRKRHWAWRMAIPVATFLLATLVQALVWDPLILPWLAGPPPA